jgi:homoserine kinase
MLVIKTPATSGNVAVGFDTLGLAVNIYNEFGFELCDEFQLVGFPQDLQEDENLVLSSYLAFSREYLTEENIIKVKINLFKNDIPVSRGLGSSATCILAGVIAANHFNELGKTFNECVEFSAKLEGHSDNVFTCAYGRLTASVLLENSSYHQTFTVDSKYRFFMLIPETLGSTKALRAVLPKQVDLNDAVFNLSRIIFVPKLFEETNFESLKAILTDKLHQQYRYPYLPLYSDIQKLSERDDMIVCISGSGPTVLVISEKDITEYLQHLTGMFKLKEVFISEGLVQEIREK